MNHRKNVSIVKIQFYVLSLLLFFLLMLVLTIDVPITFSPYAEFIGLFNLFRRNVLSIFSIIMVCSGLVIMKLLKYKWKGVTNPPYRIEKVESRNYDYLTFLATYVIPIFSIDFNCNRHVIVLFILYIAIGYIFIKMDLYYGNPSLVLLGYRLYKVEVGGVGKTTSKILITRDTLTDGKFIEWIEIDDNTWFAKENKNL